MDIPAIAEAITSWTNGYPYLVSRICQIIDTELVPDRSTLHEAWSQGGVDEAANRIITTPSSLLNSLMRHVNDHSAFSRELYEWIYRGQAIEYISSNRTQQAFLLYGYGRVEGHRLVPHNEIFKSHLIRFFDDTIKSNPSYWMNAVKPKAPDKYLDAQDNLDVRQILEDFTQDYEKIRIMTRDKTKQRRKEKQFVEDVGRRIFLLYLSRCINQTGTYSIEEQTFDGRRMDVVIHCHCKVYVIELKIWHGAQYHASGEKQLVGYLESHGLDTGYMLSFNFNQNKQVGITTRKVNGKTLYEAMV